MNRPLHRQPKTAPLVCVAALLLACNSTQPTSPVRRDPPAAAQPVNAPAGAADLPVVLQTGKTDCGPAALTMTLNYYGHTTSLASLKATMQPGPDGTSALDIVNVARASGLGVTGVTAAADQILRVLQRGDILHVDWDHFVVVDQVSPAAIQIIDPGLGRRTMNHAQFIEHYSGTALLFAASPAALEAREQAIGLSPDR